MKIQGIRITEVLSVKLSDILKEVPNGNFFFWSILFLDGIPNPGRGEFLAEYKKQINKSENGLRIDWEDLLSLSSQFYQIFEVIVLGSSDVNLLHRYKNEQEMYTTCDIVIDLMDCAFWEIYAKEKNIILRLKKKFPKSELLGL